MVLENRVQFHNSGRHFLSRCMDAEDPCYLQFTFSRGCIPCHGLGILAHPVNKNLSLPTGCKDAHCAARKGNREGCNYEGVKEAGPEMEAKHCCQAATIIRSHLSRAGKEVDSLQFRLFWTQSKVFYFFLR